MVENYSLSTHLQEILTPPEFVELVEKFGGLSLYIAQTSKKIGHDIALPTKDKLAENFGGIYITIPMARKFRAHYYKSQGYNKRFIAVKLGMTESSVRRLFSRTEDTVKTEKSIRQLDMIDYLIAHKRS